MFQTILKRSLMILVYHHKDELSVNNNNSLNDNLNKIKNLLMNYENKIQEIDSKVVKLNIDEKINLKKKD